MSEDTGGGVSKEGDALAGFPFFPFLSLSFLFFSFLFFLLPLLQTGQTTSCVFPPSGHLVFAPALAFFLFCIWGRGSGAGEPGGYKVRTDRQTKMANSRTDW